jgi:hypothetical protein
MYIGSLGSAEAPKDSWATGITDEDLQLQSLGAADPLSSSIYNLGLQQTQAWDPIQEAARKDQSWGQTQQKVGERYSRAGLTGSSQELGDLANTAKNFELDWGERAPKQRADALTSVLPIQNFRRGVANDAQAQSNADRTYNRSLQTDAQTQSNLDRAFKLQGENADTAMWANLLASSGLPTWLSSVLFGTGTPAASGTSTGGVAGQGVNALLKLLSGGSNTSGSGFSTDQLNAMDPAIDWTNAGDWWNQNYLTDTSFNADVPSWLSDLSGYF